MEDYRDFTDRERELVERLLSEDFPGCEQLQQQLEDCKVRSIDEDGSLEISVNASAAAALVNSRVPVEAEGVDSDGVPVHALLHVTDGTARELELYKADGSRIRRWPKANTLEVFVPKSGSL